MNITILESGFVTGDFLSPVAYAGEINSRQLNIVHPNYENCYYQLIIIKDNHAYKLGINDGVVLLPPSLMDVPGKLECCFVALRDNTKNELSSENCNCLPTFSNDCSSMLMKSDKFTLTIAEGLNLNGLSPIPPYEELMDAYNNLAKAKLAVEQAKLDNQAIAISIDEKIKELQGTGYAKNLEAEILNRTNKDNELEHQIKELQKNTSNRIDDFMNKYFSNSSIKSLDNSIILTNSVEILENFMLPQDIKLIIPNNITLKLDKDSFIQGEINISGCIEFLGMMNVTGKIICVNKINNFKFNSDSAIKFYQGSELYELETTIIGENGLKINSSISEIKFINDFNNIYIYGNNVINNLNLFAPLNITGNLLIENLITLNSYINVINSNTNVILNNVFVDKSIDNWTNYFIGSSNTSKFIFGDNESIPENLRNTKYEWNNEWILIN